MQRTKTFTRALVIALAVAVIAVPASLARPIDLGTPNPQEPATRSGPQLDPEGPVYWSYDHPAERPQGHAASTGDDTPWAIVGLAVAGGCLLLGGVTVVSRSLARERRARVAA